ncbi:sensor histidine kinase [Micromonospora sp. NPDC006431]|uniref:sensor histidine kinase n=1 Tax=Micromonospora sp. NPDC006431 TaxID=3364235 RepID=UPI00368395A5
MTLARLRDPGLIPFVLGPLIGVLAVVETTLDPFFGDAAVATWVSGVLLGGGIVLARWFPLTGTLLAAGCYPVGALLGAKGPGGAAMIGLIGVVGWVGWREPPRRSSLALGAGAVALALTSVVTGKPSWELLFVPAILLPGWFLGLLARANAARAAQLADLAAALEAEREANAQAAVVQERARIAREVHDAVAHSVSVMTLQLGGLRRQLADRPEQQEIVLGLERLGRQSVEEMRGLVGILRESGTAEAAAPQPTLERADALLAEVARAGLPVRLRVEGETVPPAPHPGHLGLPGAAGGDDERAAPRRFRTDGGDDLLRPGRGLRGRGQRARRGSAGSGSPWPGGHGLVGMRERVALFGGSFDAGPLPDGGYAVRAHFAVPGR